MNNSKKLLLAGALLAFGGITQQASGEEAYDPERAFVAQLSGKPFVTPEVRDSFSRQGGAVSSRVDASVEQDDVARIGGRVERLSSSASAPTLHDSSFANSVERDDVERLGGKVERLSPSPARAGLGG
ncbi:MAG: hypothetical protein WDN46_19000 [Methylocella sp.]